MTVFLAKAFVWITRTERKTTWPRAGSAASSSTIFAKNGVKVAVEQQRMERSILRSQNCDDRINNITLNGNLEPRVLTVIRSDDLERPGGRSSPLKPL
jgi:hypothetical protein